MLDNADGGFDCREDMKICNETLVAQSAKCGFLIQIFIGLRKEGNETLVS